MTDQQIDEFLEMLAKSPTSARDMVRGLFAANEAKAAPASTQDEPFGYFRAEPFGWTDCAATDEGAIALYERPAAPAVPQGEPVAWMVWAGILDMRPVMTLFATKELAEAHARQIKSNTEVRPVPAAPAAPSQEPAVPQGEPEAYMVYGNYTRQPFRSIESAQAYMGGLLKSDPEGGYHIRPLFYATPAAPSQPAVPQGWTDADSDAARLALELECLLLDTENLSVVSKWWASANEALELHRRRLATPAAPSQEPYKDSTPHLSEKEALR